MYSYTLIQWLAFFYIYSFFGWIFESCYVSFLKRRFVNRGFLRLPLLPLYGTGAVTILWVSLPFRNSLPMVFLSGTIAATALEYITGFVMERLFCVKYWDYSNQKFQLDGYICLSSSIAWGCLTILLTEVIHQPVARFVAGLSSSFLLFCTVFVSILFLADVFASVREALALGNALKTMTRLRSEIEELQKRLETLEEEAAGLGMELLDETELKLSAAGHSAKERFKTARNDFEERLEETKLNVAEKFSEARSDTKERFLSAASQLNDARLRLERLTEGGKIRRFYRRGLFYGNPGAVSRRFPEAFSELKRLSEKSGFKKDSEKKK